MLFSATLDGVVGNMARRITKDPLVIQIASATNRHENIVQKVHFVDDLSHKNRLLDHLLRDESLDQAVVFTATKRDADMIADRLNIAGFAAAALHGDMHQGARNRTLDSLRRGQVRVLVATDVAARGIDVPNITHVVNYDLPKFPEDYVHRIGRTGRAGRNGIAISLVNHAEGMNVRRIERFTKQPIPVDVVEGFEPKRAAPARSASRPGWKPGDGRNGKPGQRSFGKPSYGDRAPREGGGYERPQYESRYADRGPREGGYERAQGESRYADRGPREGGYGDRPQREGGFRREGGYGDRPQREGGYRRDAAPESRTSREGGFDRPQRDSAPREGGYRGNRPEGARREGGYSKPAHPRSADSSRRSFGDF
jgi:superfamily II DNA/RNA helicase